MNRAGFLRLPPLYRVVPYLFLFRGGSAFLLTFVAFSRMYRLEVQTEPAACFGAHPLRTWIHTYVVFICCGPLQQYSTPSLSLSFGVYRCRCPFDAFTRIHSHSFYSR